MRQQRVVITGMGAVSPFGESVATLTDSVAANACAIFALPEGSIPGMTSRVVARVPSVSAKRIPRDVRRTMSPMSVFACLAAWEALAQSGLTMDAADTAQAGVAIGSTLGSPSTMHEFFTALLCDHALDEVRSTTFFKVMSHSVAANVAQACHCNGRTLAPAAA